jgi:glycosyltransferase involved in cell wall biosynthesis
MPTIRFCAAVEPDGDKILPVVSVVTVAFNSARTIGRTIDSIAAQTYPSIQYIVIDGGSTDGTVDLLRTRKTINDWVSEPDKGISDAFNKGIARATGEFIALVNSDDWLEPTHLETAVRCLRASNAGFVFGDLMLHGEDDRASHLFMGDSEYVRSIRHSMPHLNHPTIVCRRELYETYGLYDTSLRNAMDYEWLLRIHHAGVIGIYAPGLMSHMSMQGVSNLAYERGLREVRDISTRYGYPHALAQLRLVSRLCRARVRRALLMLLPRRLYDWMRRRVNSHYRGVQA